MALARIQREELGPLSPKSANIQYKAKPQKQKDAKVMVDDEAKRIEAEKKAAKEKEYAPPPPEWVIQPPISKGALAEKYRTGRLLGKGGFAMAYEGELRNKGSEMDRKVFALKVVRAKMSQKKMEDKFRTELQIHAKMRHPNIVEFHRAFTYKESTYVVLEMCSNGSVMDMVKKRRCLTLPEVRRLTVQLCGAIKYMHTRNVIHRDLKMGNLFLDQDMNLKIGDFGLAAVLVNKDEYEGLFDYAKSRRTTLCGTPNYIAPEILEKGKGGHDHKVDIWAIGVILFAMIAGQPPFQSSSQTEIYKRARNVDYAWPEQGKHTNDIPEEAKDLVARLLKVDADLRPDPDHIVGHSFFSMHGGDAIPARMEDYFRTEKPLYLDHKARPRGDVMLPGTDKLSLRQLAKECGVGFLPGCLAAQTLVGEDIDLSLYKECAVEEAAGLGPVVPVPSDSVYVSKYSFGSSDISREPRKTVRASKSSRTLKTEKIPPVPPLPASENRPTLAKTERIRRPPVQSHAATLRAAHFNPKPPALHVDPELVEIDMNKADLKTSTIGSGRARRGLLSDLPVRPTSTSTTSNEQTATNTDRKPRTTRSRKPILIDEVEDPEPAKFKPRRPMTKDEYIDATSPDPDKKRSDMAARTRARIASNVQKELSDDPPKPPKISFQPSTSSSTYTPATKRLPSTCTLFSSCESVESLPKSKPSQVLNSLSTLHANLISALTGSTSLDRGSNHALISSGKKTINSRPVVVKWVDYTNKFGIGYILANGTVGCVFKAEAPPSNNPTCILVSNSESHLKKRKNDPTYDERFQVVRPSGQKVQFIENAGAEGLLRVCVEAKSFMVKVSKDGTVGEKLQPGDTKEEYEKRRKLSLWDKFGKYMVQSLGKADEDEDHEEITEQQGEDGPYIRFYQRLGHVGVWCFGDKALQFNFPDHTKLRIDPQGQWIDFYHLPLTSALALNQGGRLDLADLAARGVASWPVDVVLGGSYEDRSGRVERFGDVMEANRLRSKLEFAATVVGEWVRGRGLGKMGVKGLKWEGEVPEDGAAEGRKGKGKGKSVWVTVGAEGGDERYE